MPNRWRGNAHGRCWGTFAGQSPRMASLAPAHTVIALDQGIGNLRNRGAQKETIKYTFAILASLISKSAGEKTMATPTEKMVPEVNLLDCDKEPTDTQLESLMRSVMDDVQARARKANQILRDTLAHELSDAHHKYRP
jgi:hypothetical protein